MKLLPRQGIFYLVRSSHTNTSSCSFNQNNYISTSHQKHFHLVPPCQRGISSFSNNSQTGGYLTTRPRSHSVLKIQKFKFSNASGTEDDVRAFEVSISSWDRLVARSPVPVLVNCYDQNIEFTQNLTHFVNNVMCGPFRLANLNLREETVLANILQIHSPAVYLVSKGYLVLCSVREPDFHDVMFHIQHALKEASVEELNTVDGILTEANKNILNDSTDGIVEIAGKILADPVSAPQHPLALAALLNCANVEKNYDWGLLLLRRLKSEHPHSLNNPEIKKAIEDWEYGRKQLHHSVLPGPSTRQSQEGSQVEQTVYNGHLKHYQLAQQLASQGRYKEALTNLFEILKEDKTWNNAGAPALISKILKKMDPEDPETIKMRRRFASMLFI